MESVHMPERIRRGFLMRIGVLLCVCAGLCMLLAVKPEASPVMKRVNMRVGQTVRLKMDGVNQSLIWRIASGKKRVRLWQDGRLKAKRSGKAVIKAVCNGVTYRFRIRIRPKKKGQSQLMREIMLKVAPPGLTGTPTRGPDVYTAPPRVNLMTTSGKKVAEENIILIGDSRFEGMHNLVGGTSTWICSVGEGIYWLRDSVKPQLDTMDVKNKAVVFNLGINDLTETSVYLSVMQSIGNNLRKRGATVYFMTVNPVDEAVEASYGYTVQNQSVVDFNRTLAQSLYGFGIIDTYDYLVDHSFETTDGVHYTNDVYRMIYSVLCVAVRKA